MTKITVTIDTKSNAKLFLEMLNDISFIKKVEADEVYADTLSEEEIKMLEERLEEYEKHPENVKTWEQVKAEMIKKYGR